MALLKKEYPATLDIAYPGKLNRLTTFFRIFLALPILILCGLLVGSDNWSFMDDTSKESTATTISLATSLTIVTALMILFRQRYPRWWYDFALELNRFSTRVGAYLFLLTDVYPSTVEAQSVRLDAKYPDAQKDLNRWLPLIKWLLALPHYVVLLFLMIAALIVTVVAWFAILITSRYPKRLYDFVVGVGRWAWRVSAYAFLLTTDKYPPFSLK